MSYNGWKNYETWNVALWLGNDEGAYQAGRDAAANEAFTAASAEAFVRELWPRGTPDFRNRGGSKAYALVEWSAIADMLNDE